MATKYFVSLFTFVLIFFFFFLAPSYAAIECSVSNTATCSTCNTATNTQSCSGVWYDPADPYNTQQNPLIGQSCTASRTCNISQVSCDCAGNGFASPAVSCQAGSTCSGDTTTPNCHYCVTPDRLCNSDPVCNSQYSNCSATQNTCSTNNGTQDACLYTTYNGQAGCTLNQAPNQPCTINNCNTGYTCVNGSCQPGGGGSVSCQNTHGPGDIGCGLCHDYLAAGGSCTDYGDGCCYGSPPGGNPLFCNNNRVQDNGETGVDCGGGGCPACQTTNICDSESPSWDCSRFTATNLTTGAAAVTGIAKNSVTNNNYGSHSITVAQGNAVKLTGHVNANAAGAWGMTEFKLVDLNFVSIYDCLEAASDKYNVFNFCLDNAGKIISNEKNPDGSYKRPGAGASDYWWAGDVITPHNTYDQYFWVGKFNDYKEYKGTCTASGTTTCCARRTAADGTMDCYIPTEDGCEDDINPDACTYPMGNGTNKRPIDLAKDHTAVYTFNTPGSYILQAQQRYQCGDNINNACEIKLIVKTPNPPRGTITTNPPDHCIMPDGQNSCTLDVTWNTSDADHVKITYREGARDFLTDTTQVSGTAQATVDANTRTFDLYGNSFSFPTYYSNGPIATVAFHGNPNIYGKVFVDTNENGFQDSGEPDWTSGGNVVINATQVPLDTVSGHYVDLNLMPFVNYAISFSPPPGYEMVSPPGGTKTIPLTRTTRQDFAIAPLHTVSGKVFNDQNKNKKFDGSDTPYTTTSMTIQATKTDGTILATTTTDRNGNYTLSNLPSDNTNVSLLTPVPTGFRVIWPVGSTPPTYTAQVGPSCVSSSLDTTTGASYINTSQCNIQNLNFAISNSIPWLQMMGSDGRFDTGGNNGQFTNFVSNPLVACNSGYTLLPGANSVPGVALIGSSSRDTAFGGVGVGSSNNWVLGSPFPEYFTTFGSNPAASGQGLQTSYDYILNATTKNNISLTNITTLSTCSDLSSCSITNSATNGVYQANGSVVLNGATFANGKNYILLINGDLTIKGNITVPTGSTATFAVKGNIIIDKTVGVSSTNFTCPTTATSGQIQGFFSADKSIIIDSKDSSGAGANCSDTGPNGGADLQLNVDGSLVANAGLSLGGFENRRDLCAYNITYPVLTLKERLDFMLNAPELLKTQNYIYREIAP